ncbi:MAG: phosphatidylglycerophosphatase A [Deltaproteobacteria bacterium]|nr:phosphatidylglycerophosphatase A [Deltaproteobacteria bacterium]
MRDKLTIFLATGAFVGYSPAAPGSLGTLWGVGAVWLLSGAGVYWNGAAVVVVTLVSIYIAHRAAAIIGQKDPKCVVIDEVCGLMTASFMVPFGSKTVILVFLLFRFFDILKPWPVSSIDRGMGGGAGIVLDDVAAGVYANIFAQIIIRAAAWSL